jgi:oligo-1,6-glucosidase
MMHPWWKDRIAYQIYPRSFQDSGKTANDGIGDIPGIISRLDEIKDLGAGIIWLSPVYKSPDADNGYDISDYYSIDPKFGTMADMERLFAEAAKRDIKIIMDMVINHTSDEHEWFQKSRDPASPYRDYYIWCPPRQEGAEKWLPCHFSARSFCIAKTPAKTIEPAASLPPKARRPPNNWTGFFMGEVWEYDEKSGEYYLHLFDKKQPDLNYKNPKVIEEIKKILRFWLDKGAAGFRCDVINIIYKTSLEDGKKSMAVRGIEHYKGQEGNHATLRELRRDLLDHYDCFTVGETVMVDLDEAKLLCDESRRELDMLFYFEHLEIDRRIARFIPKKFRASKLLEVLTKWQQGLQWNALYLENHDQSRIVSHFGDAGKYREQSAKMLALLELTLRGTPFIYQGQEIGMNNFDFKSLKEVNDVESHGLDKLMKKLHIPGFLRWKWIKASSRDNARTPMQWTAGENAGFSKVKPWLGVNANHKYINYESQKNDPASILNFYKSLIALRKKTECLKFGEFVPLYADDRLMLYRRTLGDEVYTVALNFSSFIAKLPQKTATCLIGAVLVSTADRTELNGTLLPWEGVLLR